MLQTSWCQCCPCVFVLLLEAGVLSPSSQPCPLVTEWDWKTHLTSGFPHSLLGLWKIHYDHVHNDKPTPASGVFHLIEKTRITFISPYTTRHVHLLMCGPDVTHCGEGVSGKRESVSRSQRTLAEECRVGGKCQVFPLLMQITWIKTQEE